MKKYDPVLIKWRDSQSPFDVWVSECEIDPEAECIVTSAGIFIGKSKKWVVLCLGVHEGMVVRPFQIPRKAIVEMKKLVVE